MSGLHCRACGRPGLSCGCPSPAAFRAHLVGTVAPATGGLLEGVNARLDALEAKTANLLRQEGVMDSLLGLVTDMVDVKHRLEQLEAQVLGLLRRTRRPGKKLRGRKRT